MDKIVAAKEYNENPGNAHAFALTPTGQLRQTGYVLIRDNGERKWFPNMGQARIEMDTPGKYPHRGEVLQKSTVKDFGHCVGAADGVHRWVRYNRGHMCMACGKTDYEVTTFSK